MFGPKYDNSFLSLSRIPVANHEFLGSWPVYMGQVCHFLKSKALRRHTTHLLQCPLVQQQTEWLVLEMYKMDFPAGTLLACHPVTQAFWTCEGHNAQSQSWSETLQSTQEPEWLRPGKCMKQGPTWESDLMELLGVRAGWTQKVHVTFGSGKTTEIHLSHATSQYK